MSDDRFPPSSPAPYSAGQPPRDTPVGWERDVLERLMFATLREQRDARRWRIAFRTLWLLLLLAIIVGLWTGGGRNTDKAMSTRHTGLVSLRGVIDADSDASAEKINGSLEAAFKDSGTAAVVMRCNSPGGSPVQAGMINDAVKRLRVAYPDKPFYVVVDEMCASGGYYAAASADRIFVDKASIVGSIGVLSDGFGFTGLMDKLGVERRLQTAGRNKGIGDPFSPLGDEQKAHLQVMLDTIHQQFIKVVRDGRGARLKETPDTFSGLFWTGEQSIALGLADDFGSVESVARDVVKADDVVDYTERQSISERLARRFGASIGSSFAGGLLESMSGGARLR
ncbi:MAG: S49 family peptidase [Burkholderiaceae bacterium]